MPLQADPAASLAIIEAQFALAIFKTTFDAPPPEGNPQQFADRGLGRCITQKVFDLVGERMIADQQVIGPFGAVPVRPSRKPARA
jgi:hypothetical protein